MKSNLALNSTSCGWGWILMFIFIGLSLFSVGLCKALSSYVCLRKWREALTLSPWWSPLLVSFQLFLDAPVETGSPCLPGSASILVGDDAHRIPPQRLQAWPLWCYATFHLFLPTSYFPKHTHMTFQVLGIQSLGKRQIFLPLVAPVSILSALSILWKSLLRYHPVNSSLRVTETNL